MDVAYDHQFQEAVTGAGSGASAGARSDKGKEPEREKESLNEELQQAYKVISNSPWGARFGAFVGTVRKQVSLAPPPPSSLCPHPVADDRELAGRIVLRDCPKRIPRRRRAGVQGVFGSGQPHARAVDRLRRESQ